MLNDRTYEILQKRNLVEVQWNNIKKYVLGTVSDLLGDSRGEQESHGLCRKD
jgi:hypothetical protein